MSATKVAYLGPEGTYTHQAARDCFPGDQYDFVAEGSIQGVVDAVAREDVSLGVVPIENSFFGSVIETFDALRHSAIGDSVSIVKEHLLAVRHCLLVRHDTTHIRGIYSHPQALGQCADYLRENFPNAKRHAVASTGAAVSMLLDPSFEEYQHSAAIGSELLATMHPDIAVMAYDIQGQEGNRTRFIVLSNPSGILSVKDVLHPELTAPRRVLLRFTPHVSSIPHTPSIHLEALVPFLPARAITRLDRRPSLSSTPFHDTVFIEIDLELVVREGEGDGRGAREIVLDAVEAAKSAGQCDIIGVWDDNGP